MIEVTAVEKKKSAAAARDRYAGWLDRVDDAALAKTKKKILAARARMTRAMFEISEHSEQLRAYSGIPISHVNTWLHEECGLSRNHMSVFRQLHTVPALTQTTIRTKRVAFDTLRALLQVDERTRNDALHRIENGQTIDAMEIRAMRNANAKAFSSDEAELFKRRGRMVERVAREQGRKVVHAFERDAAALFDLLVAFQNDREAWDDPYSENPQEAYERNIAYVFPIRELADRVRATFSDLFPGPHGAEEDIARLLLDDYEDGVKAACFNVLENLALGRFSFETGRFEVECKVSPFMVMRFLAKKSNNRSDRKRFDLRPIKTLKAIELCSGAGGEAIGLCAANFEPVLLVDNAQRAKETLKFNRPDWNVSRLNLKDCDIESEFAKYAGQIDLVSGGVPCQPLSAAGLRRGKDDKRNLFPEAVKVVKAVQPKAFFFENVTGLKEESHSTLRLGIMAQLEALDYSVGSFTLNASDWGLPQNRERIIIYGVAKKLRTSAFQVPTPIPGLQKATLASAAADLLFPWKSDSPWLAHSTGERFSEADQQLYDQWADKWLGKNGHKIAPTVTNWPIKKESILDDWKARGMNFNDLVVDARRPGEISEADLVEPIVPITISLLKRLQGFPDDWALSPGAGLAASAKLIGNAFPPVLARMIGHRMHAVLSGDVVDLERAVADGIKKPEPRPIQNSGNVLIYPDDPQRQRAEETRQRVIERRRLDAADMLEDESPYDLDDPYPYEREEPSELHSVKPFTMSSKA